jgi:hypothetical protein
MAQTTKAKTTQTFTLDGSPVKMKMEMRWQVTVLVAACMMLVVAEAAFSPTGDMGHQQRRPIVHRTTTVHRHAGSTPTELKGLSQKVYQFTQVPPPSLHLLPFSSF